jgi:hypothetical protein
MTLKKYTPLFTASVLALAVAGTGCSTTTAHPSAANQDRNLLGLITIKPDSFAHASPSSTELHTNELINSPDMSGTQISLIWGAINLEDY